MSSEDKIAFTRENLNMYLNDVSKRYKKLSGDKVPAEIILIGGASILVNYGFRNSTTDIDAIIHAASCMNEAIYFVSDKYGLYDGWLNTDFMRTSSFSPKLVQYSKFYRTFANVVDVRTIEGEYLLAMKLVSGRQYKHDLSDIIGILNEEKKRGNNITLAKIRKAVEDLYGNWDIVPETPRRFIEDVLEKNNYERIFSEIEEREKRTKEAVLEFRMMHPEQTKRKTASEVIEMLRAEDKEADSIEKDKGNTYRRCVIVGGADINSYGRVRRYLKEDDFVIYCDSGLRHMDGLGAAPSLIIGDWDSYDDPHMDVETITLPVAKDDTDTVFAMREGMSRGFKDFLLIGCIGARLDHTLVNTYILATLENNGCHGMIIDDYSEIEIVSSHVDEDGAVHPGRTEVSDIYTFFSLVALEGEVRGVTIKNARFEIENAIISPDYQYATSNEPLPGKTAEITVEKGRLLLIRVN